MTGICFASKLFEFRESQSTFTLLQRSKLTVSHCRDFIAMKAIVLVTIAFIHAVTSSGENFCPKCPSLACVLPETETCADVTENPCQGKPNGVTFQFCKTCTKYVICNGNQPELKSCGTFFIWDQSIKKCVNPWESRTCVPTPQDLLGQVCPYLSVHGYMNLNQQFYVENCLYFKNDRPSCLNMCETNKLKRWKSGSVVLLNDPHACEGKAEGKYPLCFTATSFGWCYMGHMHKFPCTFENEIGTTWDQNQQACVDPWENTGIISPSSEDFQNIICPSYKERYENNILTGDGRKYYEQHCVESLKAVVSVEVHEIQKAK